MWIVAVVTSEFFWGVIVGLVLSVVGAYYLAVFATRQQQRAQKEIVKNFCADTIKNLRQIVDEMADLRNRTKAIHSDYLALMDIEFNVFGRNREHIIQLPEPLRDRVRKFVTDCAVRRAQIGNYLAAFTSKWALADQLLGQNQGLQSQQARAESGPPLAEANKVLDELSVRVQESSSLINDIKNA